jgi:putative transcriptional regulator
MILLRRAPAICVLLAVLVMAGAASAQERGVVLVAKPDLPDPNFARTVVVVAQDERGGALGVVLNRPAALSLAQVMDNDPRFARFTEPMYLGGPVERLGLFAVFRAERPPGPALRIAEDLWLALLPETVERLIADPPAQLRLYVGYAGWAPGQLAAEIDRGSWWVIDPDADVAFRTDTRGLWDELATRASSIRTHYRPSPHAPRMSASLALAR